MALRRTEESHRQAKGLDMQPALAILGPLADAQIEAAAAVREALPSLAAAAELAAGRLRERRPAGLCGGGKLRHDGDGRRAGIAGHIRHRAGKHRHPFCRRRGKLARSGGWTRRRHGPCRQRCRCCRHDAERLHDRGFGERLDTLCGRRAEEGARTWRAVHRHGQQYRRAASSPGPMSRSICRRRRKSSPARREWERARRRRSRSTCFPPCWPSGSAMCMMATWSVVRPDNAKLKAPRRSHRCGDRRLRRR